MSVTPNKEEQPKIAIPYDAVLNAEKDGKIYMARIVRLMRDTEEDVQAIVVRTLPRNNSVTYQTPDGTSVEVGVVHSCQLEPRVFSRIKFNKNVTVEAGHWEQDPKNVGKLLASSPMWIEGLAKPKPDGSRPNPFGYLSATNVTASFSCPGRTPYDVPDLSIMRRLAQAQLPPEGLDSLIGRIVKDEARKRSDVIIGINRDEEYYLLAPVPDFPIQRNGCNFELITGGLLDADDSEEDDIIALWNKPENLPDPDGNSDDGMGGLEDE